MPRRYRLGERESGIQATRERIVDAAIELYTEDGISATTLREIGSRADVAPGTLRNHFPTRDDLDRAIVERMTAGVTLPDTSIFDDAVGVEQRLERLVRAGGVFMEQARPLYRMWLREPMLTGPWNEKGAEYGRRWDELMRSAIAPIDDDDEAFGILRAVLHPDFFDTIKAGRRSADEASSLIAAVITPWFVERAKARSRGDRPRREPRGRR